MLFTGPKCSRGEKVYCNAPRAASKGKKRGASERKRGALSKSCKVMQALFAISVAVRIHQSENANGLIQGIASFKPIPIMFAGPKPKINRQDEMTASVSSPVQLRRVSNFFQHFWHITWRAFEHLQCQE